MNLALDYNGPLVLERTAVCCHEFDPSEWDYAQHNWQNKLFLKESVFPWARGKAIARMLKKARQADAIPGNAHALVLTQDASPLKSELYMAVTRAIPNQQIERLSGVFISRVFEEPKGKTQLCLRGLNGYLTSIGKVARKYFFYYPYCQGCARKHGHHYVVAIAETKSIDPYYLR